MKKKIIVTKDIPRDFFTRNHSIVPYIYMRVVFRIFDSMPKPCKHNTGTVLITRDYFYLHQFSIHLFHLPAAASDKYHLKLNIL